MLRFLNNKDWRIHGAWILVAWFVCQTACAGAADPLQQQLQSAAQKYVDVLASAAAEHPSSKTFRDVMRPLVNGLKGFRGATLLGPDFVIRQVYYRRHAGGIGYDVKSHDALKGFYTMMCEAPAPQVSGPTRARLWRPSYVALRHPIVRDGELLGVVSLFVGTDTFLQGTALANCGAYRISSPDVESVSKGSLPPECRRVVVKLPSTEWTVEYDEQ
jgi:hypothetical protein